MLLASAKNTSAAWALSTFPFIAPPSTPMKLLDVALLM